jgi:hypothetical protein
MYRFPRFRVLALAALTAAVVVMAANAQPPGEGPRGPGGRRGPGGFVGGPGGFRGGPGRGGVAGLIQSEQVQQELKLSEAQVEKVRELGQEIREEMRKFFGGREGAEDLTREQRMARMQEAMEKFRQEAEKRAPEIEKRVRDILEPAQYKRVKQIEMQLQGVDALVRADIIQALGITEDQQKKIKEVLEKRNKKREELGEQMRGMFEGFRDMSDEKREQARAKGEELREKGRAIQSEAQKNAMGVLTDDQKAMMPNLMGEPFEFRRPEGGPGEGRRGEGRRGEGGEGRGGGGRRGRRPGGNQ